MLGRVKTLQKKMTNVQILQQSVLLKHKGLFHFLQATCALCSFGDHFVCWVLQLVLLRVL